MSTTNSSRKSGTPFYVAEGNVIRKLDAAGVYQPWGAVNRADGLDAEAAEAIVELMDRADLARSLRRWTEEASCFHAAMSIEGLVTVD